MADRGESREIRAFVAGATGYTGGAVVRALARRGASVRAHVRPDSPRLALWRERLAAPGVTVDETPWEEGALVTALGAFPPTHVFALLGTTRARAAAAARAGDPAADYEAVDYGLTVLLLRAAAAAARGGAAPRFVYLSSLGATAATGNEYLRARGRVEALIRESGLPHLIVRPSFISGPDREERRPLERALARAVGLGTAALGALGAARLRARYHPRTAAELAEAVVRLALAGREGVVEGEEL